VVDAATLQRDARLVGQLQPYMGSQPTFIRRALDQLGDIAGSTFVDIGCSKGRPLIVASEYPFALALGCDISADLVKTANANAVVMARRYPQRPPLARCTPMSPISKCRRVRWSHLCSIRSPLS
jgi:SAM-dependent methyltransferase